MGIHSLTDIKSLRKKYHLNQKELAQRANVSQSLIAKIEAGMVDPSFTKAQQIFEVLHHLREKEELKAREVMRTKVLFAQGSDALREVIKTMKSKGISQMPVLMNEKVAGLITEGTILRHLAENPEKIKRLKVGEVMEETPPIVTVKTGMRVLLELLREHPIILVAERGEIKGLISKTDLLGRVE
ncbi:CBS domain-containing protein [Candidatus Woesearchaeota archaeon]|nr:CBS domain-containing protein [Candidatus Woesearchaeota archaeon]